MLFSAGLVEQSVVKEREGTALMDATLAYATRRFGEQLSRKRSSSDVYANVKDEDDYVENPSSSSTGIKNAAAVYALALRKRHRLSAPGTYPIADDP